MPTHTRVGVSGDLGPSFHHLSLARSQQDNHAEPLAGPLCCMVSVTSVPADINYFVFPRNKIQKQLLGQEHIPVQLQGT